MRTMTRTTTFLSLALMMVGAGTAAGQKNFEGVVTYQMSAGGMDMEMVQMVKGGQIRQELNNPMGQMVSIMNEAKGTVVVLLPAQKMYMQMDVEAAKEQARQMNPQMADEANQIKPTDFKATGEKETIAGHACEHYAAEKGGNKVDVCAATGMGYVLGGMGGRPGGRGGQSGLGMDLADFQKQFPNGFFPLKMTMEAMGQTVTMEATKIEAKQLGDDLFKIPDGYTEMQMPGRGGRG